MDDELGQELKRATAVTALEQSFLPFSVGDDV